MPPRYRLLSRTDAQWREIERAERTRQSCAASGETLDQAYATLLSDLDGDTEVFDAGQSLLALGDVREVFELWP